MKCSKCGDETPENKIKYFHQQRLCGWCWDEVKNKTITRRSFVAWVERNKEKVKEEMMK